MTKILCKNKKCDECNWFREEDYTEEDITDEINNGFPSGKLNPKIKEIWIKDHKKCGLIVNELKSMVEKYIILEDKIRKTDNMLVKKMYDYGPNEDDIPLCQTFFGFSDAFEDEPERAKIWDEHIRIMNLRESLLQKVK